jgi:hypothetical protein
MKGPRTPCRFGVRTNKSLKYNSLKTNYYFSSKFEIESFVQQVDNEDKEEP